jgi:hypothetical protein
MTRVALPVGSIATAAGRQLVTAVRRLQQRARLVVFLNQMFSAIAVGGAATSAWNVVSAPLAQGRWMALTVALASALVAAAMLTYLRSPTLAATGAAIDRRLHLQDRIAAALQVGRESDSVSVLVVQDAAAHLGRFTPAEVFPLILGRHAVVGTLLMAVAFLTVTIEWPRAVDPRAPGTGAGLVAMSQPEGATAAADRPSDAPAAAAESTVRSLPSSDRRSGPGEADSLPQRGGETAAERDRLPGASEPPAVAPAPTASRTAEPDSRVVSSSARSSGPPQAEPGGLGAGPAGRTAASTTSEAARGAGATGAGGSAPAAERVTGGASGGVAAGGLDSTGLAASSASPRSVESSRGAPGGSRAQAGPALSRDDIPPARRDYVRDYFLRLRSTGQPR